MIERLWRGYCEAVCSGREEERMSEDDGLLLCTVCFEDTDKYRGVVCTRSSVTLESILYELIL